MWPFFSCKGLGEWVKGRHFQDMKGSLRTDYFSNLPLEDHLPRPPAAGFYPADSVLSSLDNYPVVLVEAPRCCWPHPEKHFPPHPSGESPAGNSALILSSFCLLYVTFFIDFDNWMVNMGSSPSPCCSPIPQTLVLKGLVSRITVAFPSPSAALQADGFLTALFLGGFAWSSAWGRFPF